MTSRRGFLIGIGAALAAPAIVKAESLMKIAVLRQEINEASLRSLLERITVIERGPLVLTAPMSCTLFKVAEDRWIMQHIPLEDVYAQAP